MSSVRIIYTPRPDTTPESEVSALAAIYKFALAKQRAAHPAAPNEAKGSENDRPAKRILPS
jgi:hypothetical protein